MTDCPHAWEKRVECCGGYYCEACIVKHRSKDHMSWLKPASSNRLHYFENGWSKCMHYSTDTIIVVPGLPRPLECRACAKSLKVIAQ